MKLKCALLVYCLYQLFLGVAQADLIGFYTFDDAAAPLADDSGKGNVLVSADADPTYVSDGGVDGGAFEFDGTQRLVIPLDVNPDTIAELTIGAWVKTDVADAPGLYKVMGHDNGGWDRTIGLDNRTGDFRYTAFVGNRRPVVDTPGPVNNDDWTFFAVGYDQPNNEVTVYVDLDSSSTVDPLVAVTEPSAMGPGLSTFSLGNLRPDNANEGWIGFIDNAFVFDELLDAGKLTQIRDGGTEAVNGDLAANDPAIALAGGEVYGRLDSLPGRQERSVTVGNEGATNNLTFTSVTVTGAQASFYEVVTTPAMIGPGATGDIVVAFDPDKESGDFAATLVIQSNDAAVPQVTVDLAAKVAAPSVSGSLLGFYTFDDADAPLSDSSGRANSLQEPGGAANPTYGEASGIQGGAYSFDGSQRLIAPININPDEVPELTVGAWVKTSSLDPGLRKVMGGDNGGWDRTIGLDNREGDFRYTAFVGNAPPVAGTPGPESTDDWTFLAATFDEPNDEVIVYVDTDVSSLDDDLVAVAGPTGFGPGFDTISIGSLRPDNATEGWAGEIDNVFIIPNIVPKEQLDKFRAGGRSAIESFAFGPPKGNLVGFWNFDDPTKPAADASGNDNDLDDQVATPTYLPAGGIEAGAYEFDGGQRLVADIDVNPEELPQMTWGAWVKPSNTNPGLKKIMGHDDGGWDRTIGLDNRTGDFRYTSFVGNQRPVVDTPGPENTDDWTFIAATYDEDAGEVTVYVDIDAGSIGDELVAVTEPTVFNPGQSQFSIGSLRPDNGAEGWVGLIDNAFLYNTTLTSAQLNFMRDGGSGAILGSSGDDPDLVFTRDLAFGELTSRDAVTRSIAVQNGGRSNALTVTSVVVEGPDAAFYTVDAFPASLDPGANGTIDITLDPRGQVGEFTANLRLETNDTSQPITNVNLRALTPSTGETDPSLEGPLISPFGNLLPGVHERTIAIRNNGAASDLVISGIEVIGSEAAKYTFGALPGPIAPGGSGELLVTFDPGEDFGTFRAALNVTSNNGADRFSTIDVGAVVPILNPEDALIAFYSFDDPSNPLKDDSEKGNVLEIPEDAEPTHLPMDGFDGSGAFEFDGAQRLIAPIDINTSEIPELTLGAWVKPSNIDPGLRKVIGHDNGGWDRAIGLDNREGELRYSAFIGNGRPVVETPGPENTEDWTFLAVVYDQPNNEVTVYVDIDASSIDDDLVAVSEPTSFNSGQPTVSIGSIRPDNNAEGWVGLIDKAFFFDAAFDPETIRELRDGGILPGSEDPNVRLAGQFGDLGNGIRVVTREVTVRNGGREQVLNLTGSRITGPDAGNYTLSGDLPETLAPGESATLSVTLDPQGRTGGFVAFLEIDSDDAGDPTETLDLSALIPLNAALVAHYKLDETDGAAMLDSSGRGAHGTYTSANGGGFNLGQDPLATGKAIELDTSEDGGAGFGEVPASGSFEEFTDFSVSMWVNRVVGADGVAALFSKGTGAGDPFAVAVIGDSLVWFSGGVQTLTVEGAFTPGENTHVLTTFENVDGVPTAAFYVNGTEVGRESGVEPFSDAQSSIFQIGALTGTFGFKGIIDDVQIYSEALTADDAKFFVNNPGQVVPGEGDGMIVPGPELGAIGPVNLSPDGISLTLPAGATLDIEYSTDLETWDVIANGASGVYQDTDAGRRGASGGYYRGRRE